MNTEEKIAYNFLKDQGFKRITFEPNGKSKPPDFLIENNVAIEVRRMNKYLKSNDRNIPIEKTTYEFVPKFKNLLKEIDDPNLSYSIGVTLRYKRPIRVTKDLLNSLKESIKVSTKSELFSEEIMFNEQIRYVLFKAHGKSNETYKLIVIHDKDSGGKVQDARYDSLKICIEDKTKKLQLIKNNYSEVWLILVDDIFSGVDYTTKQDFQRFPEIRTFFERIILLSKFDEKEWIDLYPWKI